MHNLSDRDAPAPCAAHFGSKFLDVDIPRAGMIGSPSTKRAVAPAKLWWRTAAEPRDRRLALAFERWQVGREALRARTIKASAE